LVACQLKCLNNSGVVFPLTRKFKPWTHSLSALGRASRLPARDWFGHGICGGWLPESPPVP
jgi:hypothetical protein